MVTATGNISCSEVKHSTAGLAQCACVKERTLDLVILDYFLFSGGGG